MRTAFALWRSRHKTVALSTDVFSVADEHDLVLAGFIGFLDPPKESAREAIAALHEHGVNVVGLIGDNDIVTRRVCHDVGIPADRVVVGAELERLSDDELRTAAQRASIFAKLNPLQKGARRSRASAGQAYGGLSRRWDQRRSRVARCRHRDLGAATRTS